MKLPKKSKEEKKKVRGNVQTRPDQTKKEKKKKKKSNGLDKHMCICTGHFYHLPIKFFLISLLSILMGPRRKHPGPINFFSLSPSYQTSIKKVILPIFSPKFYIYLISPPNKHTLNVFDI